MRFKKKGLFISLEGPEASGKSTQLKLLKKFFIKNNIPFITTREPGGTIIAEKLRKIILDKDKSITLIEELLLLMSSRLNHINNIIKPSLKKNKIVISDRFADSTFIYQGYVGKIGLNKVMNLHKILLDNYLPHKTFLFCLPINEINNRLKKRKKGNKYDKIDSTFHLKVINGYKKISKNNKRFVKINAMNTTENIHDQIVQNIINLIKK